MAWRPDLPVWTLHCLSAWLLLPPWRRKPFHLLRCPTLVRYQEGRYPTNPTASDPVQQLLAGRSGAPSARLVLAGPDTIHLSADITVSDAVRAKLDAEKELAQLTSADGRTAHCPEWLGAPVFPHGSTRR